MRSDQEVDTVNHDKLMEKKIHSTPNDKKGKAGEPTITAGMIQSALHVEKEREEAERKAWFVENFDSLTLLDIYASEWIGEIRRNVIRDLLQAQAPEEVIKSIIRPEIEYKMSRLNVQKILYKNVQLICRF